MESSPKGAVSPRDQTGGRSFLTLRGSAHESEGNRLLRALPKNEYDRLLPHLEHAALPFRHVLLEPGERLTHVYFPTSGVASMINETRDGTVEVASIGNEGLVGVPVLLHSEHVENRVFMQVPGEGKRMTAVALRGAIQERPVIARLFYRYAEALFEQIAQSVACNRLHTLEERCARSLLITHDRVDDDTFPLTQEILSYMLGVHRPAVTVAAGILADSGLIKYHRGRITVTDRAGLEAAACVCYATSRASIARLYS
ncbi:MAG: Crp/Fnr family transcriptional regulator [Gemmatimonadota bacterium]|nr:Crp/Fnr family transcriptional regulator [Gemmatimonadota bacterium]